MTRPQSHQLHSRRHVLVRPPPLAGVSAEGQSCRTPLLPDDRLPQVLQVAEMKPWWEDSWFVLLFFATLTSPCVTLATLEGGGQSLAKVEAPGLRPLHGGFPGKAGLCGLGHPQEKHTSDGAIPSAKSVLLLRLQKQPWRCPLSVPLPGDSTQADAELPGTAVLVTWAAASQRRMCCPSEDIQAWAGAIGGCVTAR